MSRRSTPRPRRLLLWVAPAAVLLCASYYLLEGLRRGAHAAPEDPAAAESPPVHTPREDMTLLEATLDASMAEHVTDEETQRIVDWIRAGASEETYAAVQPILARRCVVCHNQDDMPELSLQTYAELSAFTQRPEASNGSEVTALETSLNGSMADYITDEDKARVIAWLHAGASAPDYTAIAPILEENCAVCHNTGDMPEMPLTAYDEVMAFVGAAPAAPAADTPLEASLKGSMADFITEDGAATIAAWIRAGATEQGFSDVAAILEENCVVCHNAADMPDFPLETYGQVMAFVPTEAPSEGPPPPEGSPLHPAVRLVDAAGQSVLKSGGPVSPMRSCGQCHDTTYIAAHSYHVSAGLEEWSDDGEYTAGRPWDLSPGYFGRWDPLEYRVLTPKGDPDIDLGTADWIRLFGVRHVGGGPAHTSRTGRPLSELEPGTVPDAETHVRNIESGEIEPWDWRASGAVEMNCFLCHIPNPDNAARRQELRAGRFAWAATATLAQTGLVKRVEDRWEWNAAAFAGNGSVARRQLNIADPCSTNCGLCHGVVTTHVGPEVLDPSVFQWTTETTGIILSPERLTRSDLPLVNGANLERPWDVHAQRLLDCNDCHYSLNNPAYKEMREAPEHLRFDARRTDIGDYLKQPSHQFAKGQSAHGDVADRLAGSMRRCDGCHNIETTHDWLPYKQRHMNAMTCEACHIPRLFGPARAQTDWTVLSPDGRPRVIYRGREGEPGSENLHLTGYVPVLLPRTHVDGKVRLAPYNLVSSWYWVGGDPARPVPLHLLLGAMFEGSEYHPEIAAALDADGDGHVDEAELALDAPAKVDAVRRRLRAVGVHRPEIRGEIQPFGLHHNVAPGAYATRDCATCHEATSRVTRPLLMATYVPGDVLPALVPDANTSLAGRVERLEGGGLAFVPETREAGFYILGHDYWRFGNVLGLLAVVGVLCGAAVHGVIRIVLHVLRGR